MIDQPQGAKPALTVVIQSWWTPAFSVIMLVIGLVAGYFCRPLLTGGASKTPVAAVATTVPVANEPNAAGESLVPTAEVDPTLAAINSQEQLMAYLISHTTHFQGDPNAKVTIIEFSDYQ